MDEININITAYERTVKVYQEYLYSQRNSIPIVTLPHARGEITHNDIDKTQIIWAKENERDLPKEVINRELDDLRLISCMLKTDIRDLKI